MATNRPFDGYVFGAEAARLFGVGRADSVWRMISRHGDDYPGPLEVVQFGRTKMFRRQQLVDFTAWFAARIGDRSRCAPVPLATPRATVTDERRAKLAQQIARLTEDSHAR